MEWMATGGNQKSMGKVDHSANEVLGLEQFKLEDLADFSAQQENACLDLSDKHDLDSPFTHNGWIESTIQISVPTGSKDSSGCGQPCFVPGLHHHPLLDVMHAALADATARFFHFSPFKCIWKPQFGPEVHCFDEAFTSDAWIESHNDLQKQPNTRL